MESLILHKRTSARLTKRVVAVLFLVGFSITGSPCKASEAAADIVGMTGSSFVIHLSPGRYEINRAFFDLSNGSQIDLQVTNNEADLAQGKNAAAIVVPTLPSGDSEIQLEISAINLSGAPCTPEGDIKIEIQTVAAGSAVAHVPANTISCVHLPDVLAPSADVIELFGK